MRFTQLSRFARLFLFALAPGLLLVVSTNASQLTIAGVVAVAVPAFETTWRQMFPAAPIPKTSPPAPAGTP